uniref:Transglycosylase n=1 Tax=Globodera pallida TaxID=36090 RepID=A0A183CQY3_GLOPA
WGSIWRPFGEEKIRYRELEHAWSAFSGTSPNGKLSAVPDNGAPLNNTTPIAKPLKASENDQSLNGTAPIAKPLKASENDQSLNGTAPTVPQTVVAESVLNGTTADTKKIGPPRAGMLKFDDVESALSAPIDVEWKN